MNGKDLIWEKNVSGITYRPSEKDNSIILISSYGKIEQRFNLIREKFPNAVITDITDEFGYGNFEVKLQ